jgi:peptide/nickel transport system permease protein
MKGPAAWAALAMLVVLLAGAALAPLVARYRPTDLDLANRRAAPSTEHWFGTDELGRDVFARVLHGARVSLAVGLLSAFVAAGIGVFVGGTAGLLGGPADAMLMRGTDAMLAVPRLLLLMIAGAVLSPSVPLLIALVGAVGWMETAKVVRSEILSLRTRAFVDAARATGAGTLHIMTRHLLPNAAAPLLVATTLAVSRSILLESTLSFFGVGVQPPAASWGSMLYQAQTTMTTEPWLAIFPGLSILVTTLSVNTLGETISPGRSAT